MIKNCIFKLGVLKAWTVLSPLDGIDYGQVPEWFYFVALCCTCGVLLFGLRNFYMGPLSKSDVASLIFFSTKYIYLPG